MMRRRAGEQRTTPSHSHRQGLKTREALLPIHPSFQILRIQQRFSLSTPTTKSPLLLSPLSPPPIPFLFMADFHSGFRPAGFDNYGDRKLEIVHGRTFTSTHTYYGPPVPASSYDHHPHPHPQPRTKQTKAPSSSSSSAWGFNDPEMKRRKRVAKYKMYAVEGKVKSSFRKSFRWLKRRCSELVHSW
ncbi:hypothetical protein ACLOJK_026390 [Asimina triloba]